MYETKFKDIRFNKINRNKQRLIPLILIKVLLSCEFPSSITLSRLHSIWNSDFHTEFML